MAIPPRGNTGNGTYFITASCWEKINLFQTDRMCRLFLDVLYHYREQDKYLLHELVVMPNHFHLLISPEVALERAMQFIKGGFSHRAKKELSFNREIWQSSFYDHRVRDTEEYQRFRIYIHQNPVKRNLVTAPDLYPYSSAFPGFILDEVPQRLKPSARATDMQA